MQENKLVKQVKKDKKLQGIYQQLASSFVLVFNEEDLRGVMNHYDRLYQAYEALEDYSFKVIQVANSLWLSKDTTPDDLFHKADDYLADFWD